MKIYFGCIPCFARQAVEAAEMATANPKLREKIIREALRVASIIPFDKTPPHMGKEIHRIVRNTVGKNIDPYKSLKDKYNKKAMEIYPEMKKIVKKSKNPLETAVRIAIAGNIIDFGITTTDSIIHLMDMVNETLSKPFAIDDFNQFKEDLKSARKILYLADNAGEIVFDRILIEEIPNYKDRVTMAVKGHPIINDATIEDARQTGLTEVIRVVENGSDAPGTILEECSEDFRKEVENADLLISKGQGNYETLSETGYNVYFLLKAKCPVIAGDLGVNVGDIVIKRGKHNDK